MTFHLFQRFTEFTFIKNARNQICEKPIFLIFFIRSGNWQKPRSMYSNRNRWITIWKQWKLIDNNIHPRLTMNEIEVAWWHICKAISLWLFHFAINCHVIYKYFICTLSLLLECIDIKRRVYNFNDLIIRMSN